MKKRKLTQRLASHPITRKVTNHPITQRTARTTRTLTKWKFYFDIITGLALLGAQTMPSNQPAPPYTNSPSTSEVYMIRDDSQEYLIEHMEKMYKPEKDFF